jgi:phosphoglycerate dehydrogenase-like enzyme
VGLEGVDLAAANKKGVYVCNIPAHVTPNAQSTAEHAILLMLGAARKVKELATAFHEGIWGAPVGEGIFGSRALIVGYGNVGRSLARKLSGLDLSVDAIKREWGPDDGDPFIEVKARPDQLPDLAARADFVISAASLNESSRHMFNREIFSRMKKTSILINISRGPLVSEKDLIEALEKGEIAGAGLDVFEKEPLESDSPLLKMNNVFATPHVGGVTRQNYQAMGEKVARNISLVAKGETPDYCVNLDSL